MESYDFDLHLTFDLDLTVQFLHVTLCQCWGILDKIEQSTAMACQILAKLLQDDHWTCLHMSYGIDLDIVVRKACFHIISHCSALACHILTKLV